MSLLIGSTNASNVYLGTTPVDKVYLGNVQVWPVAALNTAEIDVVGTPAVSGTNANILTTANAPITVSAGLSNSMLCALVYCSHANSSNYTAYQALTCTSSVGGSLTRLATASVNVSGNQLGSVHLFYRLAPTSGAQNITASFRMPGTAWGDRIRVIPFSMKNVDQTTTFDTPVLTQGTGTVSNTLPSSASTSLSLFGMTGAASPTGFNQTQLALFGSTDPGSADFGLLGSALGGSSVTFTTSNSSRHGAFSVEVLGS